jgi:bile acid:Na+ symporter, BASS family
LEAADAVKFVLMVGIMLTVISVGLRSRPADTVLLLRNPKLGVRAMVSMFVVMPLFVIGLTWVLPVMDQAAHAALIALSVSPMPPILPRRQAKVGAGGDYTVGLQVLASVFSIIVAPAFIWLAG